MPYKSKWKYPVLRISLAVNVMVSVSFKKDLERRALICPSVRVTKNPCREAVERYPSILKNQPLGRLKLLSRLIETGLVPVFGDSYFIRIHVQKSHIHIELSFPTPQFGRGVETNAVIMGCRNGLCGK